MWQTTDLTEKIGIALPIIQAPMAGGATTPQLVAAVSNSGGLGSLGAGYMAPDEIRQAIKKIRELTSRPFAINLFIPEEHHATFIQIQKACDDINQTCIELGIEASPVKEPYTHSFEEQIRVIFEENVPIFSYTFGLLNSDWVSRFKKNHTILIGTATNLAEAQALKENGADIIVAQGSEAGGHRGAFLDRAENSLIGLMSLVPQLADAVKYPGLTPGVFSLLDFAPREQVRTGDPGGEFAFSPFGNPHCARSRAYARGLPGKIPIVAAGGIMDGRSIVAALNLGASGVQMGTAFLTCHESGIPPVYKQVLLAQKQDATILTRSFSGKLARGIRNKFTDNLNQSNILDYPIQNTLTSAMRKAAITQNNSNFMSLWSGQSAQLCRNIGAHELVSHLVAEVETFSN